VTKPLHGSVVPLPRARGLLKRDPPPKVVDAAQAMLKAAELGWGADSSSFRLGGTRM
jgi:hypothetical protein